MYFLDKAVDMFADYLFNGFIFSVFGGKIKIIIMKTYIDLNNLDKLPKITGKTRTGI